MSKEADAKAGLLGKVAKFIKNPTTDWAELDHAAPSSSQPAADSRESHLALKEMVKRKRGNDLVRKREFDMLRKIRRKDKEPGAGLSPMELTSSFSSSQLLDDAEKSGGEQKRARTLRQIDEIESQFSRSWFTKPGMAPTVPMKLRAPQPAQTGALTAPMTASEPAALTLRDKNPSSLPASNFPPTALPSSPVQPEPPMLTQMYPPGAVRGKANAPSSPKSEASRPPLQGIDLVLDGTTLQNKTAGWNWADLSAPDPVAAAPEPRRHPSSTPVKPQPAPKPKTARRAPFDKTAPTSTLEVTTLRHDPEIEDAAISFANGDEEAAQSQLLNLVSEGGGRRQDVGVWLTLFDLYRVTGKADAFNGLVSEFTSLFGRSAPQWEVALTPLPAPRSAAPPTAPRAGSFTWICPAELNARACAALISAVNRAAPPWRVNWQSIKTVAPDALAQLGQLFTQWADAPVQLQFLGGEQLLALLAQHSPTEDKNVNPAWWRVRLSLLRLMGLPDLFDQTALDYCITYEISPPAWTSPRSRYTPLNPDGQPQTPSGPDAPDGPPSTLTPTTLSVELLAATGVFETALTGELLGNADQALAALPASLEHVQAFDLDCRALRRVDFGAAGDLLNWSIRQQGHGRKVVFRNVHRLLAAFLLVIGIDASAQVVLRKD